MEEAEEADQVCIINAGRIVAASTPEQIKAELTSPTLLLDAENHEQLGAELQHLKLPFTEEHHFRLPLSGHEVQNALQTIKTPLSVVRTHAPTLEEVYLKLVRENA